MLKISTDAVAGIVALRDAIGRNSIRRARKLSGFRHVSGYSVRVAPNHRNSNKCTSTVGMLYSQSGTWCDHNPAGCSAAPASTPARQCLRANATAAGPKPAAVHTIYLLNRNAPLLLCNIVHQACLLDQRTTAHTMTLSLLTVSRT